MTFFNRPLALQSTTISPETSGVPCRPLIVQSRCRLAESARRPDVFTDWSDAEFDELFSRFGTGGQLTESGVLAAAEAMNAKRDVWRQVNVILESGEADIFAEFVDVLYRRAIGSAPINPPSPNGRGPG